LLGRPAFPAIFILSSTTFMILVFPYRLRTYCSTPTTVTSDSCSTVAFALFILLIFIFTTYIMLPALIISYFSAL